MFLVLHGRPTVAQPADPEFNLNLFITPADYSGCGTFVDADHLDCDGLASASRSGAAYVWVVASHEGGAPNGFGGAEFGIEYVDVDVLSWTFCAFLEIAQDGWPASGTGTAMTWDFGCYAPPGEVAKIGYFAVADASVGVMHLTGDPRLGGQALFSDCSTDVFDICALNLGSAILSQGTTPVCGDHCGSTPIMESSWSHLKRLYR